MHGSHLRWQVQTRCAPVQTSSARTLRAPPAPSRSVRADSSVRMLQGLPINNAPATRKGRCRTDASRVCCYQDGESLIRIADRDSDRCKPITSSTCVCIRVCPCIHVPIQRRCAGARRRAYRGSASESLIRVADRGRCSPITCAPTQAQCTHTALAWGHPSTRHAQPKYPCTPCR